MRDQDDQDHVHAVFAAHQQLWNGRATNWTGQCTVRFSMTRLSSIGLEICFAHSFEDAPYAVNKTKFEIGGGQKAVVSKNDTAFGVAFFRPNATALAF